MDYFNYKDDVLHAEDLAIDEIVKKYGTPCYIYSRRTIERHWHAFNDAFGEHDHLICYAVKANSNLGILDVFARLNSGFDVVSGGELERVLLAGGSPKKIIFSGVGKTASEITHALKIGIHCINVESVSELNRIQAIASQLNIKARISLRINPNIDAKTHPYISTGLKNNKFGIEFNKAKTIYVNADSYSHLEFIGIDCHIGSQLTEISPFLDALDVLLSLADDLVKEGLTIEHLDLGGGLGVTYTDETPPLPDELAKQIRQKIDNRPYEIILEPGRAIMANAGILVTKVNYLKTHHDKYFAIVDAAMNDYIRPALYQADHQIIPVKPRVDAPQHQYDIVGPVCESGDFLGLDKALALKEGDLLAIRGAGAYGASMSSNYNTRQRAAEILVDGDTHYLIRERDSFETLIRHERLLP
jgi:diaminopimelate decarboxylase